jgi:predicted TIM-barrel fold metal-dependent hydrolase
MHRLGVRGVRCNLVDRKDRSSTLPLPQLIALANRIRHLGWHLELLAHVNETPTLFDDFIHFPVDLVFGHFGYMSVAHGTQNAGFQGLLGLMAAGKAWVKMTGPYRISAQQSPPYADLESTVESVVQANPDRLVWGSDWPHVMMKSQMPNDADLVDLFANWVPDDALRKKILVDNPEQLYDFA